MSNRSLQLYFSLKSKVELSAMAPHNWRVHCALEDPLLNLQAHNNIFFFIKQTIDGVTKVGNQNYTMTQLGVKMEFGS